MNDFIRMMRNGGQVQRNHTWRTLRTQTVGEHSFGLLCIILGVAGETASRELLVAALNHDMSEQHLGDIPAPAKWRHQELNRAYVDASKAFDNDNVLMTHLSLEEKTLLKFADGLEFMIYCLEELRMGNTYAEAPFTRIDMFLNEFLGARGNGVYARAMHNMHQSCRLEYGRTDKEDYA